MMTMKNIFRLRRCCTCAVPGSVMARLAVS